MAKSTCSMAPDRLTGYAEPILSPGEEGCQQEYPRDPHEPQGVSGAELPRDTRGYL